MDWVTINFIISFDQCSTHSSSYGLGSDSWAPTGVVFKNTFTLPPDILSGKAVRR